MRGLMIAVSTAGLWVTAAAAQPAPALGPGRTPVASATNLQWLQALRDLRAAQAGITGRTDKTPVSPHERYALNYVATAIYIVQRDTNYKDAGATTADVLVHPGEGRLHDVDAYLSKARSDVNAISGNDRLKTGCIDEIGNAQLEVGRALKDYASPSGSKAPPPGGAPVASATNPQWLQALRDLRAAQAGITGRTDKTPVSPHERYALNYVATAIYIVQRDTNYKDAGATTADVSVHPGEGRLHDVDAYLSKARNDINEISANDRLKTGCIDEIGNAQLEVGRALKDYASPSSSKAKQ